MQEQLAEGLGSPTDSISDIAVHSPRQARSLLATGRANYLPAFTEKIYPMLEARLIKALAPLGFRDVMLAREALFGQKEQGGLIFPPGSSQGLANPLKATKSDQVEFLVAKAKREPAFLGKFKNPTAFQVSEAAAVDQATVVTNLHDFFSNLLEISEHLTFDTQQTIGFAYDEPILMFANAIGEDLPDATTDPRLYPPHAANWKVSGTDADPDYLLYSPVEMAILKDRRELNAEALSPACSYALQKHRTTTSGTIARQIRSALPMKFSHADFAWKIDFSCTAASVILLQWIAPPLARSGRTPGTTTSAVMEASGSKSSKLK